MKEPRSPLKERRLALGVSISDFAHKANIQPSAVGQAEEGLYRSILPSYLDALELPWQERTQLETLYQIYKREKRQFNGALSLHPILILDPVFSSSLNPLRTWREQSGIAVYKLATALALPLAIINRLESHIHTTAAIPHDIWTALTEASYGEIEGLLEEFQEAYDIHKTYLSNQITTLNRHQASA